MPLCLGKVPRYWRPGHRDRWHCELEKQNIMLTAVRGTSDRTIRLLNNQYNKIPELRFFLIWRTMISIVSKPAENVSWRRGTVHETEKIKLIQNVKLITKSRVLPARGGVGGCLGRHCRCRK